ARQDKAIAHFFIGRDSCLRSKTFLDRTAKRWPRMMVTRRTKRLLVVALIGLVTFTTFAWCGDWLAWWPQERARQALARRDYETAWRWMQRARYLDHHNA